MRSSIITINYNSSKETIKLLDSLKNQTDKDFHVLVLDNGSDKKDFENLEIWIKENFFEAILMRSEENLGFSGGNNLATQRALSDGSDWVIWLNNDTWVGKDFIAHLRPILAQKRGILGIPIDEGGHVVYGGRVKWLVETLPHNLEPAPKDYPTYAIGGAMVVNKAVFDKVGRLEEKYFLYFEDADFCLRSREKGFNIEIIEGPIVHHSVSATTKKLGSAKLLYFHYRNSLLFNYRHAPLKIRIIVPFWSFWITLKQILKITAGWKVEESRLILRGVFDYYLGKFGNL